MDGKEYIQANDSTETLFIFSDSVIGEIGSDGTLKKKEDFNFVNNVVAVLKGKEPIAENFTFYYPTDKSGKTPLFLNQTRQTQSQANITGWAMDL